MLRIRQVLLRLEPGPTRWYEEHTGKDQLLADVLGHNQVPIVYGIESASEDAKPHLFPLQLVLPDYVGVARLNAGALKGRNNTQPLELLVELDARSPVVQVHHTCESRGGSKYDVVLAGPQLPNLRTAIGRSRSEDRHVTVSCLRHNGLTDTLFHHLFSLTGYVKGLSNIVE